jgi:hypothetical protein
MSKNRDDKFYTKPEIAKECIDNIKTVIPDWQQYLWIEPSCGTGSFSNNIPAITKSITIDNDPDVPAMLHMSFLDYKNDYDYNVLLFGNPPFGRQGALAKAFIRHGAKFTKIIAFILPRSFMKPSMYSAFPKKFHKIFERELPADSFIHDGIIRSVPTVFQIWKKEKVDRISEIKCIPDGFYYTNEGYNLIVRRVGSKAGKCYLRNDSDYSPSSHYFIKIHNNEIVQNIYEQLQSFVFPDKTTGPRSISKQELNDVLNKILQECSRFNV